MRKYLSVLTAVALVTLPALAFAADEPPAPASRSGHGTATDIQKPSWALTNEQGDVAGSSRKPLEGQQVIGPGGESIGEIDNVVAIVSVGGFLGMGDKKVALSRDHLKVTKSGNDIRVTTNLTEDELRTMPEYNARGTGTN